MRGGPGCSLRNSACLVHHVRHHYKITGRLSREPSFPSWGGPSPAGPPRSVAIPRARVAGACRPPPCGPGRRGPPPGSSRRGRTGKRRRGGAHPRPRFPSDASWWRRLPRSWGHVQYLFLFLSRRLRGYPFPHAGNIPLAGESSSREVLMGRLLLAFLIAPVASAADPAPSTTLPYRAAGRVVGPAWDYLSGEPIPEAFGPGSDVQVFRASSE